MGMMNGGYNYPALLGQIEGRDTGFECIALVCLPVYIIFTPLTLQKGDPWNDYDENSPLPKLQGHL